jgi:serine phosphatase RsbU (regulator of sigma subunit)
MAEIADRFRKKCADSPEMMVGALVDSMPYPLIVRDMEYRVVLANEAAGEFYARELLECKCYEASELRGCLCEDCPAREAFQTGRPVERELRHPDTGDYLVIGVYPMYEPDGEACAIIETVRDVTEARRREDKIRSLLTQMTAKNRELTDWRQGFQYELRVAREIQRRLVPAGPLCVGEVCFDFLYRPSGEVGGDLFDVLPLDDGRVGMVISDASGHGVGAALIAVMVRMVCNSYGLDRGNPVAVMEALNDELMRVVPQGQFATAFYGVCQSAAGELRFASAGHPSPLLIRAGSNGAEWLEEGDLPLGSLKEAEFTERTVEFGPADKLLTFTDGVLDIAGEAGQRFGLGRLKEVALANRGASGPDFIRAVIEGVEDFAGGRKATDDMTIALVESVAGGNQRERWPAENGRD